MASTEPVARVFFALVPPPEVQQALAQLALETARRAHGRPVPAENLHLTLAFIGAWPVARLPGLLDVGANVHGERLKIALDTLGAFRRAGIAWIGPSAPPPALLRLAASLADVLAAAGVALDAQVFRPHVTLARHCRGRYPRGIAGPISFPGDGFSLMRSQTDAQGARYREVASWPLLEAPQVGHAR